MYLYGNLFDEQYNLRVIESTLQRDATTATWSCTSGLCPCGQLGNGNWSVVMGEERKSASIALPEGD